MMHNTFFSENMKNVREHRDMQLVIKEKGSYSVLEPDYNTAKFFTWYILAIGMEKNENAYEQTCLFRTFNTRIK